MSINSAMQTGVTGLVANSQALTTISNNIANVNTTGYKTEDTNFEDIVNGTATGVNTAGGVAAVTQQTVTTTGTLSSTNSSLDLGIDGQGFFVVSTTPTSPSTTSSVNFTRDGSFQTDKNGFLENADGMYLEGWPVNADGSISTNSSDLGSLQPINISDIGGTAQATTQVAINANLQSSQATTTFDAGTYDPTSPTESMSTYSISPPNGTKPDFEITIPVSDSQGGQQDLTMSLLKSGANTWDYEIWSPNVADANGNTISTGGLGQVATGTLVFNSSGQLDLTQSTSNDLTTNPPTAGAPGSFNPDITIGASGSGTTPSWSNALGVAGQTIAMSLGSSTTGGLTQFDSASTTQSVTSNGTAFGNLTSISVGTNGMVSAVFDNGVTRNIAQVALATFINANGLTPVSGNAYQVSTQSGTFSLQTPGVGGTGEISPDTLEASTVDLSQQFTDLITTQRAYSAASKIITTADEMMQELLTLIQ